MVGVRVTHGERIFDCGLITRHSLLMASIRGRNRAFGRTMGVPNMLLTVVGEGVGECG